MRVIQAPHEIPSDALRPRIFLSGGFDRGLFRANWRGKIASALAEFEGTLIDPTRRDWSAHWERHERAEPFRGQVLWELEALEQADRILCRFDAASPSPISLLEFGLYAKSAKTQVICSPRYRHAGNVRLVCEAENIPLWDDLDGWLGHARAHFPRRRLPKPPA